MGEHNAYARPTFTWVHSPQGNGSWRTQRSSCRILAMYPVHDAHRDRGVFNGALETTKGSISNIYVSPQSKGPVEWNIVRIQQQGIVQACLQMWVGAAPILKLYQFNGPRVSGGGKKSYTGIPVPIYLGPPVVPFYPFFGWEGSPTKINYSQELVPLF